MRENYVFIIINYYYYYKLYFFKLHIFHNFVITVMNLLLETLTFPGFILKNANYSRSSIESAINSRIRISIVWADSSCTR